MKFCHVFVKFSTFLDVFERVWTRSDMFGQVRIHSDALEGAQMHENDVGQFRKVLDSRGFSFVLRISTADFVIAFAKSFFCSWVLPGYSDTVISGM